MLVGGSRFAHCAAVAWSLGNGIDDEIFEAVTQPEVAREGERDFRVMDGSRRRCRAYELRVEIAEVARYLSRLRVVAEAGHSYR